MQSASGTEFIDTWHVRDYLGSVRAVYDITPDPEDVTSAGSQILEQNDYYAFGGRIDDPYQPYDQTNRYRYNGKEQLWFEGINLDPGLTDYGARYYAPAFGRWTTPDPLADKYYSVSPYAFCNNNPVNFIDPDGERWINSQGQIIYDKRGVSAYASQDERALISTMLKTRTGRKQLNKIANLNFDVVVAIDNEQLTNKYGIAYVYGIKYSTSSDIYSPIRGCKIVIFKRKAARRSALLSVDEAMAVNLAHEIEHTTNENLRLQFNKSSENEIETEPDKISKAIINEYYIMKPLTSTAELMSLVNSMVQSNSNIEVEFKN